MRAETTGAKAAGDIASIQYLRGIAALMVVAFHLKIRLARMGYEGVWPEWLSCGVDIFFVISGAIMWLTTCDRAMSPREFLLRRFLRIAPLYYAMTAAIILILAVAPSLVAGGRIDTHHILASLLFLPAAHPVLGSMEPVLPQGWTLNYEMGFYLLFAAALLLSRPFRPWAVFLALLALVFAGIGSDPHSMFGFFTSSIILEFAFGIFVGMALTSGLRVPAWIASALLAVGAIGIPATWSFVEGGIPRALLSGVAAASLVAGAIFLERRHAIAKSRVLHLLGDASYSIYLVHGLALSAIAAVWMRTGFGVGAMALAGFSVVGVIGATLVGIALHITLEKPLHNLSRLATRRSDVRTVKPYSRL